MIANANIAELMPKNNAPAVYGSNGANGIENIAVVRG
jgi:hypothetical protein